MGKSDTRITITINQLVRQSMFIEIKRKSKSENILLKLNLKNKFIRINEWKPKIV